jgi:queuosine precursor transporter
MVPLIENRAVRLFMILTGLFVSNALIAEFVGVKIFALEPTLGLQPLDWNLFGQTGSLSFTAGVLLWPFVFILTDTINEYFGVRGVRFISYVAAALITYAFVMAYLTIGLEPASWWVTVNTERGVPDMQAAFSNIFGQGLWTIGGSLVAFLFGQLIDVVVFHKIRRWSGERMVWLRATASTFISQFIDSFVVLYIAFVLGPQQWPTSLFLAVGTVNFIYKMFAAVAMIPLLYLARKWIEDYLGAETATRLKAEAAAD